MGVDLEFVNRTKKVYVLPGFRFAVFRADTEEGQRARLALARLIGEDGPWWFDHVVVSHDHDTASDDCELVEMHDAMGQPHRIADDGKPQVGRPASGGRARGVGGDR